MTTTLTGTPSRLMGMAAVCELTGMSRQTIYNWLARGQFPTPRKLGPAQVSPIAWLESEIRDWMESRPLATYGANTWRGRAGKVAQEVRAVA
jgi:prophage regulatory protein